MSTIFAAIRVGQIDVVAGERGFYRYIAQASMAFDKAVFAKACEKSAAARGPSEKDAPPFRDGSGLISDRDYPHPAGLPAEHLVDAMVTQLEETIIEFDVLEELFER